MQYYDSKEKYIRYLIYGALIVGAMIFQFSNIALPEIFGARAFLLLPLSVCIAMHEREIPAALFGCLSGIAWDVVSANEGFSAFVIAVICAVCSILISRLMRNNVITAFVLCGGAVAVYEILYIFVNIALCGAGGTIVSFFAFYLPSLIYTVLFVPVYYTLVKYVYNSHKASDE